MLFQKRRQLNSIFIFLLLTLIKYGEAYMVGNNPNHHRELLDEGKYQLDWLVNMEQKMITFQVVAQTAGYVGFGLSANGKMTGADIIIGGVKSNGRPYFGDYHAVGQQTPVLDPSQDWKFLSARQNGTHTMLSFSRALDTCDPQDYVITENKISVIWAYGTRDDIRYHYETRGMYNLYLLNPDFTPQIITDPGTGAQLVLDQNGKVDNSILVWTVSRAMALPEQETLYWCNIHKTPRLLRKNHIIGFQVRLHDEASLKHVHHLGALRCNPPRGQGETAFDMFDRFAGTEGGDCLTVGAPIESEVVPIPYCTQFNQGWAVGGRAYFHPPHVGLPFYSEEYFMTQIHLNNPEILANIRINMSIDFFYTDKIRTHEAGAVNVRHEIPGLPPSFLVPPRTSGHQIRGICGSQCTRDMLPPEGILIYAVYPHTHNAGRSLRVRHFRNNRELPFLIADENFSFSFQHPRTLREERRVLPGDQLIAECVYDTANQTVVGGFATKQEMCFIMLLEYERVTDIIYCDSQIVSAEDARYFLAGAENVTWSPSDLDFVVAGSHPLAGKTVTEISDSHVDWTAEKRQELQRRHLYRPHVNRCLPEFWTLDPGVNQLEIPGVPVSYPYEAIPYRPERVCTKSNRHYYGR